MPMEGQLFWRGHVFVVRSEAVCPKCGIPTVCRAHSFIGERYARFIRCLRHREGLDPKTGEKWPRA